MTSLSASSTDPPTPTSPTSSEQSTAAEPLAPGHDVTRSSALPQNTMASRQGNPQIHVGQQLPPSGPVAPLGMGRTTIVLLCFILIALDRAKLLMAIHPVVVTLYTWFVLLSAFGILLGVANVFYVHLRRIANGQAEWGLSLVLVATGMATLVAGLLQSSGVTSPLVEWIFDALLAPGAATLYALVIFFMAAAAYRYLRLTAPGGGWMLAGALLMLLFQMPVSTNVLSPLFGDTMAWLLQAPVMATFRGALLGSALALLLIGARYLLGRIEL